MIAFGRPEGERRRFEHGAAQGLHGLATIFGPPLYGLAFAWALRGSGNLDLTPLAVLVAVAFLIAGFAMTFRAPRRGHEVS